MAWRGRYDEAEPQRVNRWLAQNDVCSRREAETLIAEGRVLIDGVRVDDVGRKIAHGQTLEITAADAPAFTAVLNKPVGVVSVLPQSGQIPAARLLSQKNLVGESAIVPRRDQKLAPLGRLDRDSRGLLLLSEDGALARAVIGPASALDKEYLVRVEGAIDERRLGLLRHGLKLDGRPLKPAKVTRAGPQRLRFILSEGRNRQIRLMCELAGLTVADLFRIRIGPLRLGDLPEGRWRALAAAERAALIEAAK